MAEGEVFDAEGWGTVRTELRSFIRRRVETSEAAEDITQDVLERMHRADLSGVSNLYAWMYRAARNAVTDHYRSRRPTTPLADTDPHELWPDTTHHEPPAAVQELARCLRPLIEHLPTSSRQALLAVDLDGRTHQDVANEVGLSLSGMKSRVQRGRRQLGELLNQCCAVQLSRDGDMTYQPMASACDC
jgi:RNA polymerase sigma-70 factor, ECF subfamily